MRGCVKKHADCKAKEDKMRKILLLGLILTGFIYALPLVAQYMDHPDGVMQDVLSVHAELPKTPAAKGQDVKITVSVDGEAREMNLEDYVAGVVAAEISPTFPKEALKAQAVAARTYAAYKLTTGRPEAHASADVCDNYRHCAAYLDLKTEASARWGKQAAGYESSILEAVAATAGEVVEYEGKPIIAVFSAASSEKTESSADVWGSDVPYLQNVESPGGEGCPKYKGEVRLTLQEFRNKIAAALPAADLSGEPGTWFKASERSPAGGIRSVKLGGVRVRGVDLREALGLNSTNFTIRLGEDTITFQTTGYGHGVGLSQYGAKYLAEQGEDYKQILTHYYQDTAVEKWSGVS